MKLFRIALLICALAALLTVSAAADRVEYAVTGGSIYFDTATGAVTNCDNWVTEAHIPAEIGGISVTSIGSRAFSGCRGLTAVMIPASVTSIGDWAFYGCTGLTAVTIPASVTSIGDGAFYGCMGLTAVTIPASVTSIGSEVFEGCTSLTDIYYGGTEAQWKAIDIGWYNDPLTNAQIHYNSAMPDNPTPPAFAPSVPTTPDDKTITAANLADLTAVTVPVQYSGETAQSVSVAVAFYDEYGRFAGIGTVTVTVENGTNNVRIPIDGVTGAAQMKTLIWNADSVPLCGAGDYQIPGA